jgi:hypothetical protein
VYGAESFSFIGIQWTDSRDVVSEKLKKSNEFEGLRDRGPNDQKVKYLLDGRYNIPYSLVQSNKTLSDINSKLEECGGNPIIRVYADENLKRYSSNTKDSIVTTNGKFFFSTFDEKLLYYTIEIKSGKTDSVLRTLQEKYGKGQHVEEQTENKPKKNPEWQMWETGNELLFASITGGGGLVFVNTANLRNIVGPCMEGKKVNMEQDKTKASKLF